MYYIYQKMYNTKIDKAKTNLQGLYEAHRGVVKALQPYEFYLNNNGITIDDLNKGVFNPLPANDFSHQGTVVSIFYNNSVRSFDTIKYHKKEYDKLVKGFLKQEVFYKVLKIAMKKLCESMVEEKYKFNMGRFGVFQISHRYVGKGIKWKESEENKKRLKEEGKFVEGMSWVISGESTYLIPEWVRDYSIAGQNALRNFEYKVPKSKYGIISMTSKKSETLTMSGKLDYPPYKELNIIKQK